MYACVYINIYIYIHIDIVNVWGFNLAMYH